MKKLGIRVMLTAVLLSSLCASALAAPRRVIPGGTTIGVKLFTEGLVVTGFEAASAAKDAGIKKGDVIIEINGEQVRTTEALRTCLARERVVVTVLRNGREAEFCVKPREKRLGAYVRDSVSGIGTLTYYDPETRRFGALGHGVNEGDGTALLPMDRGITVASSVERIVKGRNGSPGELKGTFDTTRILGEVDCNSRQGIFGTMLLPMTGTAMEVAEPEMVRTGKAAILSNISGSNVKAYAVEILKIDQDADQSGRNLKLRITDPELLRQTGGIVQGMSGSPIIQNGKLVGAVTHVLINQSDTGYGIFIENMLENER